MQTAPTATIHHCPDTATRTSPATAASPKHPNAAARTVDGLAAREPTSRNGPTRSSSVPRMPSE